MGVMNNQMVVFGGIIDVTRESDEVFTFDFQTQEWRLLDLNHEGGEDQAQKGEPRLTTEDSYSPNDNNPTATKKNNTT